LRYLLFCIMAGNESLYKADAEAFGANMNNIAHSQTMLAAIRNYQKVGSSLRLHAQMWASPIFYFKHTRLCIVCWCLRLKAFELWE